MYQQQPQTGYYQFIPHPQQPPQFQQPQPYYQQQQHYEQPPQFHQQQQYYQQQQQHEQQQLQNITPQKFQQSYIPAPTQSNAATPLSCEDQHYLEPGVPLYADYCNNNINSDRGVNVASKFVVQGYKDVWAAVLFILLTLSVIGVGSYNFQHNFSVVREITTDFVIYFRWAGIGIGIGLAAGIVSLVIFYSAPQVSIVGANVLVALMFAVLGVLFLTFDFLYGAIAMFIMGALRLLILFIYRKHIPISGLVLKQATKLSKRQPMTTIVAFTTLLAFGAWCCFAFATVFPTIYKVLKTDVDDSSGNYTDTNDNTNDNNGGDLPSTGLMIGLCFFFMFSCFWASQVAFNVGHTTFCGVTATWYFCGQDTMPSNPTLHSAKRALTTSFGSICLGSLLVAILRTMRYILRLSPCRRGVCFCIALCVLGCLEALVRLFNHYAFAYVAIYGCDFVDGAKKTMKIITTSPYLVVFNNLLLNGMLVTFAFVMSIAVGFGTFYVSQDYPAEVDRDGDDDELHSVIYAVVCAFSCLLTITQMFRVIDSTSTTLLVCLSEEPRLIFSTNPEFANELATRAADAGIDVL